MGERRHFTKLLFGVVAIALFLAACNGNRRSTARRSGMQPGASVPATMPRTLSPLPVRPLPERLKAVRDQALVSASTLRALEWKNDIRMTELSGWEYGTRTKELAEVLGGDDLKALSQLAVAGGIFPVGTDLRTLAVSFTAASAGATYSPLDKQVLLLADESKTNSSRDQSLFTHEFVHALQDQHFDLLKMLVARPYNFDRTEAFFAVVEGDAMNVQRRLESGGDGAWARRTLEDISRQEDERFSEYRKEYGSLFPPLLVETFVFRYRDGARFVETVRRNRTPRLSADDLFKNPPRSSEQILHPEKYLGALTGKGGDEPREIQTNETAFAADGWRMTASTPLGEIGVRGLLMAGVSAREAALAAAGWGGDRACLFENPGHVPLFVWKTVWDKPEDAQEFFRAYSTLLRQRKGTQESNIAFAPGGEASLVYREAGLLTLLRIEGDNVLILRGAETDLPVVLQLIQR